MNSAQRSIQPKWGTREKFMRSQVMWYWPHHPPICVWKYGCLHHMPNNLRCGKGPWALHFTAPPKFIPYPMNKCMGCHKTNDCLRGGLSGSEEEETFWWRITPWLQSNSLANENISFKISLVYIGKNPPEIEPIRLFLMIRTSKVVSTWSSVSTPLPASLDISKGTNWF